MISWRLGGLLKFVRPCAMSPYYRRPAQSETTRARAKYAGRASHLRARAPSRCAASVGIALCAEIVKCGRLWRLFFARHELPPPRPKCHPKRRRRRHLSSSASARGRRLAAPPIARGVPVLCVAAISAWRGQAICRPVIFHPACQCQ